MKDDDCRQLKSGISGVLIVDKPVGMTSHDVVSVIRRGTGIRRVGHTGTLDPRASGVLVVLIGPAVRLSEYLVSETKTYEAVIHLGKYSETYDGEGPFSDGTGKVPDGDAPILAAIEKFKGDIEQIPPVYSAIKLNGRKAYDLARSGETVEMTARTVHISAFDLIEYTPPELIVDITCSSGTYIRSIANDLGRELGCGGYLSALRRRVSGKFSLLNAVPLGDLKKSFEDGDWFRFLIPAAEALPYEQVDVDMENEGFILHGRRIPASIGEHTLAKAVSEQGELLALLEYCPDTNEWKPKKVFYQL